MVAFHAENAMAVLLLLAAQFVSIDRERSAVSWAD
jgi:hypothetical protein